LIAYFVTVCVELHAEIKALADDPDPDRRPVVGYYRRYGVSAATETEALELVSAAIADGDIDWADSRIALADLGTLTPQIVERSGDWSQKGVWYTGGRILFPGADPDAPATVGKRRQS
jgi:hypothetical protein